MVIEVNFPRGGRKPLPESDKPLKFKKEYDLFGRNRKQEGKKRKEKQDKPILEKPEPLSKDIEAVSAELISYRTLQDGMVLLGCIREVQKMTIGINLPGRLFGRVMITHISKPYTQLLHSIVDDKEPEEYKSLRQIYSPGQCVAVKVINVDGTDEKFRIGLSMLPQDVNSQLSHMSVIKGMILWGAISSVEEHGYIVDLGINNCRAFLKKDNVDKDKEFVIGELSWFVVQKSDSSSTATTVNLNAFTDKIENMKVINEVNLDNLLPGMKVDFTISKRLTNGIEGKFLNDYTGYIHISHLKGQYLNLKNYSIDQVLEARIMYVMPVTKLAYLTLRDLKTHDKGDIEDGNLVNCSIVCIAKKGLYIQMNKDKTLKGFVSFRRLKKQLPINSEMDDTVVVRNDYPLHSKHKCRVLSYDYFEQVYICSLEKELIKNIIFSIKDLKVGQQVTAIVKEIQTAGLLVQVDHLTCFIRNIHISDVILSSYTNIKSKFKIGQSIKAKVLLINEKDNSCQLTIKPSLINAESTLTEYDQIEFNKQFVGIIKQITVKGILIEFFGNIYGWVPKNQISFERQVDPEALYKVGQVVNCSVINFTPKTNRLTLSLLPPKITSKKKLLKLGQHVDAIVDNIVDLGIEVTVVDYNIPGIIPLMHITKFSNIAHILAATFKTGDKLTNLVCINPGIRMPALSIRDSHLYEDNIPEFDKLQVNTVLPCSVQYLNNKFMFLRTIFKDFTNYLSVPINDISDFGTVDDIDIKKNQYILAKVLNIEKNKEINKSTVLATTKLNECWDFNLNESIDRLNEYINEFEKIRTHFKSINKPLACLTLGEIVSGVVHEKTDNGAYIVNLKNGARGIVQLEHVTEEITVGKEVKGVVLWLDFINDFAEISLCTKLMTRINHIQDGKINMPVGDKIVHAEVLLIKDEFALVVLKGHAGRRQFTFLPIRLHTNDFFPDYNQYVIGEEVKIEIKKIEHGRIYGLTKQSIKNNKKHIKKSKPIIKLPESKFDLSGASKNKEETSDDSGIEQNIDSSEENKITKTKKRKANSESLNEDITENKNKKKKTSQANEKSVENEETNKKLKKNKKRKSNESEDNIEKIEREEQTAEKKKKKKRKSSQSETEEENKIDEDQNGDNTENLSKEKKKKLKKEEIQKLSESKDSTEKTKKNKKRKSSETEENKINEQITQNEDNTENTLTDKKKKNKKNKNKNAELETTNQNKIIDPLNTNNQNIDTVLPGANNFWDFSESTYVETESSGDEDEIQEQITKQKKKKMTPAERAEAARLEEERIRKIETELADYESAPKTADQFDRLVLANPNNSLLWINYMAFHLEATEIEKARAVGRKALSTIEFREEQEKLNIWIALLNLENRYGTNESFETVLEEAVQLNDSLSVYLQALNILADSKKTNEFTDLLKTVTKKFKPEFKMWVEAAETCYKCDLKEEARNLMQRALKSLDEKQHVNLIVQFAFMETRFNDPERAEALLEKVLASYPRRVDVWTSYIDMLIKAERIHIARNVLERAAGQKLPARKMKTIFSKYVQFETKYGDEEKVQKVKNLAANYVKTALK